jgi:soluble lytic murein transglycosylase
MKESLLLFSFSSLLAASSGIHSQPTDKTSTAVNRASQSVHLETFSATPGPARNSLNLPLMLAKANIIDDGQNLVTVPAKTLKTDPAVAHEETSNAVINDQEDQQQASAELLDEKQLAAKFTDEEIAHLRQLFLQAENALEKKDDAAYFLLAEQLKDYPLYPYLQYQWLKKNLDKERQVKHFLETQSTSRYAGKLKYRWLRHLGKKKQWPLILQNQITTSDATLNCYYHRAQFNTGNKRAALYGARDLWAVGRSQPRVCDPLFSELRKSDLFTQELRWQRFDAALKNNKVSLASYVGNLMPKEHHATTKLWLNLHRNPSRYIPQLLSQSKKEPQNAQMALMFRHGIDRLASKDVATAIEIWDANKKDFDIEKSSADKLEKRLAMKLAFERDTGAYERFSQLEGHDNNSRTWRVRVALSEQNWQNVHDAIQALSEEEQQEEKWQYWLARADLETGKIDKAEALLSELSKNRSFYGYLAADKMNSLYQLSHRPVDVTLEEIDQLKNQKEFRVAFELMVLDKKNEAKLQWWHASKNLNKQEILVAAKLAQQWQWDEIAIFTIAKAKYWDDIEVRFPLSYTDKIHENSAQHNLNPAIVYGLIRRESAFNEKATSPTGARGLMQIMPRTGRDIARGLKERWRGKNSLYNPVTNIKYGSYYYQKLLTQFDGHYALALAAYNAGPHRVKRWLPEDKTLPADIWIETIPYRETRDYVSTVLAYTLIYQQRTQTNELSMNDFTRDVEPLDSDS